MLGYILTAVVAANLGFLFASALSVGKVSRLYAEITSMREQIAQLTHRLDNFPKAD